MGLRSISFLLIAALSLQIESAEQSLANTRSNKNNPEHPVWLVQDKTTLGEISIRAYGTTRVWKKIARINRMKPPYPVWIGRKLKLPRPIELSPEEGMRQVAEMWRLQKERSSASPQQSEAENAAAATKLEAAQAQKLVVYEDIDSSAEQLVLDAKIDVQNNQLSPAIDKFRKARLKSPDLMIAWVSEIKTLKLSGQKEMAKKTAEDFIKQHPDQADLPFITSALQTSP